MPLYRYRIKPLSAFATPLRSDTLYGHLIWRAAERFGDIKAKELIASFSGNNPPFCLSSAMPADCLPVPLLPPIDRDLFRRHFAPQGGRELVEALQEYKAFRKCTFIRYPKLQKLATHLNALELFKAWRDDPADFTVIHQKRAAQAHNNIDRNSGRVQTEGGLFFSRATWYATSAELDLYVKTDHQELFEKLFDDVAKTGFGADRGTGKGHFCWDKEAVTEFNDWPQQGNARLLLSLTAAEQLDTLSGFWKPEVKQGRAWSGFGEKNPFKKPFLALAEGSLLTRMPESGYLLRNVHSNPELVQILWPVCLPVQLEGSHEN